MAKKKPMQDAITMTVVGTVTMARRFAKGMHVRVQAEVKEGTTITQGVTIWDNDGEEASCGEGDRVYVEGYPKINTYENKDGETKSSIDCVARKFEVISYASPEDDIDY